MDLVSIRRLTVTPGDHVGDLIWWALEGARIRRPALEQLWANAGLPASALPEPPSAERALKTAAREALLGVQDHLIRLGKESDEEVVLALVREHRDGTGNVEHAQVARIRLDRSLPSSLESDAPGHELVRAVFDGYDGLRETHLVDDIRRALLKVLDACAAVAIREHGGVYWVPAQHSETARRLQAAVSHIGTSRLDILPIHATPEATEALGHAAHASIEAEVANLQREIAAFLEEPPERTSTLVRRLEQFQALRAKAGLYHSVLSVQITDLDASLDELSRTVQRLLDGATQAPAVALAT